MSRPTASRLWQMRSGVPGTEWPPLFPSQNAPLAAAIQQFEDSQWFGGDQIEAGQLRQLGRLAAHYEQESPAFRARLARSGLQAADLARPGALRSLQPLSRRELQAGGEDFFARQLPRGHGTARKTSTSGSTGEPVVVYRTAVNQLHWLALTMRFHLWAEKDFSGRICAIRANLQRPGRERNWGPPLNMFFPSGEGLKIDIQEDVDRQIDLIREFGATTLVVYPSNLAAILDRLAARRLDLPALKRIRTIGETLKPSVRERAAEELGIALFDCYSSQELGYLAIQCPEGGLYHIMSESVIVEVVRDDGQPAGEGEAGRVLVTDIHNHATPLIRYDIGDYAEPGPPCSCGRGLPTLKRILGRERNLIANPDGTRNWPLTGFRRFREIAPIVQYQLRQHELDRIEMRMVVERPLTASEEAELRRSLQRDLRYPFRFDFAYFEGRLPTGPNGKFEEFVSLL